MDYNTLISINDFKRELRLSLTGVELEDLKDEIQATSSEVMADMLGDGLAAFETEIVKTTPLQIWADLWAVAKESCVYFTYAEFMKNPGNMKKGGLYKDSISNAEQVDGIQYRNQINAIYNMGVTHYNKALNVISDGTYADVTFKIKQMRTL